eukprot:3149601-Pleurochrysis_carterae.AAC.3
MGGWSLLPPSPGNMPAPAPTGRPEAESFCCRELTLLAAGVEQDSPATVATERPEAQEQIPRKITIPANEHAAYHRLQRWKKHSIPDHNGASSNTNEDLQ